MYSQKHLAGSKLRFLVEQLPAKYEYSQFIKVELGKLRFLWMPVILFHSHRKSQHVFSKIARKTASGDAFKKTIEILT
jgi:hypothetical protein